jgi:hypothetical protein
MTLRTSIATAALIAFTNAAPAQEVSGRLDLEAIAPLGPWARLVTARVLFAENDATCPGDFGMVRFTAAGFQHYRPLLPGAGQKPLRIWGATIAPPAAITTPPDDDTQLFRLASRDCRFDITIRQQIRREDGGWASLLVPRRIRPSVPEEERRELRRQIVERLMSTSPSPDGPPEPLKKAYEAARSVGNLTQGGNGVVSSGALFDEAPETCLEAAGNYLIDQESVAFLFMTALPGDLNRFTIERTEIDADHSRLHLTQGNCRFELTVSKSIRRDGQWQAVAVAPFVKTEQPQIRIENRRNDLDQPQ